LADAREGAGVRLYLLCLMPNHVHLLVETPRGNLSAFMGRLLTAYSVYFNRNRSGGQPSLGALEEIGNGGKGLGSLQRTGSPALSQSISLLKYYLNGLLPKSPIWDRHSFCELIKCPSRRFAMMGAHQPQKQLFSYRVDLDKRVRADHPLRRIQAAVDFTFARQEVADTYGYNGNVSVDPAIVVKMMFLLFFDNVASERELMQIIPERLDYLWFLGYGLDEEIPDHSVLSKARKRWGPAVFEQLFVRVVAQCVQAGLVSGAKIHVDGSLVNANASKNSVVKASPELIAALKKAYEVEERKLEESTPENLGAPYYEAVNDRAMSTTDPDSALVKKDGESRPRYKHHRVIDDAHGVITATETTPGDVKENGQLMSLVEQHQANTGCTVATVVADKQYGTAENFRACHERGIRSHMGDLQAPQLETGRRQGIFREDDFVYDPQTDTYICPAGRRLERRKHKQRRKAYEYAASAKTCLACALRAQCTRAQGTARTIKRHEGHEAIAAARAQSHSEAARQDRRRRKWLMEGSFADAANHHGFKRARWRRRWRHRIQDLMIATVQNVRILLRHGTNSPAAMMTQRPNVFLRDLSFRFDDGAVQQNHFEPRNTLWTAVAFYMN
jgi:transposase